MNLRQFGIWKKVLGAVAVLAIAAGVSVVALVSQYDFNELKPTVEAMVEEATGRDLTINGDLDLSLSMEPSLSVTDVTFANAPWSDEGDMVKLNRLDAKVDLMSLLQGQVDVHYIVLDGMELVLATDGQGNANWEFDLGAEQGQREAGGLIVVPTVRDVRLHDVDVTYIDGATGEALNLLVNDATVRADSLDAPMRATLSATLHGVDVDAQVDMGSAALLVGHTGGPFPVDMSLSAPGLSATVKGTVDQPQAGMDVNAHLDVRVTDSAVLDTLAGAKLPDLSGMSVRAAVSGSGTRYTLSAIDARVGESDLGGTVTVDLGGTRPRFTGKVTSKVLNLDDLLDLDAPKPTADQPVDIPTTKPSGEAPPLFSRDPLPLAGLMAADADVNLSVARIQGLNLTADAFTSELKLDGGRLSVAPFSLSLEGGRVGGEARLNTAEATPAVALDAYVIELDAGRMLAALGYGGVVHLPLTGKIDVTSQGASVHDVMRHLNGHARFAAEGGRFDNSQVKNLTTGLGQILPWVKHQDGAVLSCVVGDWPIAGGVATAQTVVVDTPGFTVQVTGNVDLGGELFHLTVIPSAKSTSLASFAVPMRLKGALTQPYVDLDPGDVVVGTVGNIVKAPAGLVMDILKGILPKPDQGSVANPCLDALNGSKTQRDTPTNAPADAPPPQNGDAKPAPSGNPLGSVLNNLLGR